MTDTIQDEEIDQVFDRGFSHGAFWERQRIIQLVKEFAGNPLDSDGNCTYEAHFPGACNCILISLIEGVQDYS